MKTLGLLVLAVGLTACTGGSTTASPTGRPAVSSPVPVTTNPFAGIGSPSRGLDQYTEKGDGCKQIISAIGYADESLLPLGQEPYVEFDDVVRSKIAGVAGTIALEQDDLPSATVRQESVKVQKIADETAKLLPENDKQAEAERVQNLLRYRIEAGQLILACRSAQ